MFNERLCRHLCKAKQWVWCHLLKSSAAYRLSIDSQNPYFITMYSRDEFYYEDEAKYVADRLAVKVKEFEESVTIPASSWGILFK